MENLLRTDRATGIIQNCWVVPDLDTAMQNWLAVGYGPFLTLRIELSNMIYRGRIAPLILSIGFAHGRNVQIELIQQLSDGASIYRDCYSPDECGFHHICRVSRDCDSEIAAFQKRGIALAGEGSFGGLKFFYLDTRSTLGCMLELVPDVAPVHALYDAVTNAALNWDGSDPIRPLRL